MTNGICGEVHAPLRGAAFLLRAVRWVRTLARASHRLLSCTPPACSASSADHASARAGAVNDGSQPDACDSTRTHWFAIRISHPPRMGARTLSSTRIVFALGVAILPISYTTRAAEPPDYSAIEAIFNRDSVA